MQLKSRVQLPCMQNAIDAGFIYQKIHFFSFFFLALSRSAFEMMMEKKKENAPSHRRQIQRATGRRRKN
jgi:hypothetical protein